MAGKIRFLLLRDGRYYARKVVPEELVTIVGTRELRRPLGPDRRRAIEQLPAALVMINAKLEHGWDVLRARGESEAARLRVLAAPMDPTELARLHYAQRLAFDEELRNASSFYASIGIDDVYVAELRSIVAGKADDDQIERAVGRDLARFKDRGNIVAEPSSAEWRRAARAVAEAELEFLERLLERDDGALPWQQNHPPHLRQVQAVDDDEVFVPPVSLRGLLEDHIRHLETSGRGNAARKAWPRVFEDLIGFLQRHRKLTTKHNSQADDARLLTTDEIIAWRDEVAARLGAKTLKDVWMASIKATLQHAVEDRKIPNNPAKDVKVRYSPPVKLRSKGYSDEEATRILITCRNHEARISPSPATRESSAVTAAKRWGPLLCAFTGARVGEILQLRKSDVGMEDGEAYVHITPEAGTVKNREYRDVPLHRQIIELGFLDYVAGCGEGPLFFSKNADLEKRPAQVVAGRLSTWLRGLGLVPKGVQPNHAWRHRFKTLSRDLELDPRVVDAIQGHAGVTASDAYGDVSLRAKRAAISRLPAYKLSTKVVAEPSNQAEALLLIA